MKKFTKSVCAAAISAVISMSAVADDHKYEVMGGVGYTAYDNDRDMDDGMTGGVGLGFVLSPSWTLEAWASGSDSKDETSNVDLNGRYYHLDAVYNFAKSNSWQPYAVVGLGEQSFEIKGESEDYDETLLNLGVGAKRFLSDNLTLRGDVRAFNSLDEEKTDFGVNFALSYLIGGTSAPAVAKAEPVPVAAPVDSDGDGVYDDKDQCPDTPRNLKVDEVGCPIELSKPVSIEMKVHFDTDSAVVKEADYAEIQKVADFAKQYMNAAVKVEGHTDSTASNAYNLKLSERRAQAVEKVLEEQFGLAPDRVTAVGYGEERPIASNDTVEGRAANRRVVGEISTVVTVKVTK